MALNFRNGGSETPEWWLSFSGQVAQNGPEYSLSNLRKNKEPLLHTVVFIELKGNSIENLKEIQSEVDMYNLNGIKSRTVGDGQHGTSRWATKAEVKRTYRLIRFTPKKWRAQAENNEQPTLEHGVSVKLKEDTYMNKNIRDARYLEHTVSNEEVDQVYRPRKHRRIRRKPMLLTLCPACASQFYRMKDHYIKRLDMEQSIKEECCYCCVRCGYDFLVFDNSHKRRDFTSVA